jgi:hypothetical protein
VAELAKSFGGAAIPKVAATSAPAESNTDFGNDAYWQLDPGFSAAGVGIG